MKRTHTAVFKAVKVLFTLCLLLILSACDNPYEGLEFPGVDNNRPSRSDSCYLKQRDEGINYECYQIITDSDQYESYLRRENYVPIKTCACNIDLQLWIAHPDSDQLIDASGIVKNAPPDGDGVGDIYLNYRVNFPPLDDNNDNNIFDGNITAGTEADLPIYPPLKVNCTEYSPVKIAILDTGIDYTNNKLKDFDWEPAKLTQGCFPNSIIQPTDYVNEYGVDILQRFIEPMDFHGHGTHVQGIISGVASPDFPSRGNNGLLRDNQGFKRKSKKSEPLKFIHAKYSRGTSASGSLFDLLCAGYYVIDQGAKIINISGGFLSTTRDVANFPPFRSFLEYALQEEVLIVASIGNNGQNLEGDLGFFPASYASLYDKFPNLISVGALDANHHDHDTQDDGRLAGFSNRAFDYREMTVAAWGTGVPSTASSRLWSDFSEHQSIERQSGTSMAAPFVSRTAAIMLSLNPDLRPSQIREIIVRTATKKDGIRILNSERAINQACDGPIP